MRHLLLTSVLIIVTIISMAQINRFGFVAKQFPLFSGNVLVAENGKIVYQQSFGLANRQADTKVAQQTKFKIASVTKTFTAVLILQLAEEGKIDLSKTIGTYLPGYTGEARNKVSIHQLLTYSSGIENIDQSSESMYAMQMPTDTIIQKYCSGRLVATPGTQMNYKNADYIILGKIVEKISGKPFETVLKEKVLQPLAMNNSGYLHNRDIIKSLASTYLSDNTGIFYNDDPYWIENFYSSGSMYSTAHDLLTFDQALFTCKLLKKETVDLMTTSYPKLYGVAYSFWVNERTFGKTKAKVMDRRGGIGGANVAWYHFIDSNKTIFIIGNSNAEDVVQIREKVAIALLN